MFPFRASFPFTLSLISLPFLLHSTSLSSQSPPLSVNSLLSLSLSLSLSPKFQHFVSLVWPAFDRSFESRSIDDNHHLIGKKMGRKTETLVLQKKPPPMWKPNNYPTTARNLRKTDLAGVIFGCKHSTFKECIFKQLFGLPAPHYHYVQNVTQGMPLFLFNYSDRKLHGIFEASSTGQMNINPHAWTLDGQEITPFPAQVRVKIRMQCQPLTEDQFKPIIAENYRPHEPNHFWFELEKAQTEKLISLFSASPARQSVATPTPPTKWGNLFKQSFAAIAHNVDRNSKKTNLDVQLGTAHNGTVDKKGIKKLEASLDQEATEYQGYVPASLEEKTWIALFKPQSDSIAKKDDRDSMDVGLEVDVPCQNQVNMTWESSCSQASIERENGPNDDEISCLIQTPKSEELADIEDAIAPLTQNLSDTNLFHETSMDWDSSFELLDAPLNRTMEEEGHVTSKPRSEGCTSSVTSGILDLEDNASEDPPISGEANAEETLFSEETISEMKPSDLGTVVTKLMQTIGDLKSFQLSQIQRIQNLEEELVESKRKIQDLENHCGKYRPSTSSLSHGHVQETEFASHFQDLENSIILVGGFNGSSWLPDLVSYSPSEDVIQSLEPMGSVRSYATAVALNDELYVLGGRYGTSCQSWYDTVESYNVKSNQWITCPTLNRKKGSTEGVCLRDKIFAIGGGDATDCFSEVEMLDLDIGKWIFTRSMVEKRFAPAAAEMNGALYVAGGYDGEKYLRSMERFDPRECSWSLLRSMTTRRGSHSLTVLNDKLYAIGGYDGAQMIPTVEVFEPRVGSWIMSEPMVCSRAYMGTVTLGNAICVIGGMQDNEVLDTVECYSEGKGWQLTDLKSVGKKCCFSAIVV